jgi:hypothetical protein
MTLLYGLVTKVYIVSNVILKVDFEDIAKANYLVLKGSTAVDLTRNESFLSC